MTTSVSMTIYLYIYIYLTGLFLTGSWRLSPLKCRYCSTYVWKIVVERQTGNIGSQYGAIQDIQSYELHMLGILFRLIIPPVSQLHCLLISNREQLLRVHLPSCSSQKNHSRMEPETFRWKKKQKELARRGLCNGWVKNGGKTCTGKAHMHVNFDLSVVQEVTTITGKIKIREVAHKISVRYFFLLSYILGNRSFKFDHVNTSGDYFYQ